MALNETNATGYNLRRAQAFAAAGINDGDVVYAHPEFVGKGLGDCALCGKKNIMWHYAIRFDAPTIVDSIVGVGKGITRTEAVTFKPVGSECIQTWAEPLPDSAEKLEFLLRWERELRKCAAAKSKQATDNGLAKAGVGGTQDALAREAALADEQRAGLTYYERRTLRNLARKLAQTGKLSPKVLQQFAQALLKAEAIVVAPPAPLTPAPAPAPAQPCQPTLLERAEIVIANPAALAALNTGQRDALLDIARKVKKYKNFASDRQRSFFSVLVARAEAAVAPAPPPPAVVVADVVEETVEAEGLAESKSGEAGFKSASGIAGARY